MFNASFLFASLIWGSIGMGYFIYGKKQGSWVPMVGGIAMMAVSYVGGTALIMSLISIAIIVGVYVLLKEGY
ncbi:MAG TPA: amino acid transport protein [Verrucomicrobiae bacterium]|nr:amino acid transport protein [Verrucomicrobiae bacterium]